MNVHGADAELEKAVAGLHDLRARHELDAVNPRARRPVREVASTCRQYPADA